MGPARSLGVLVALAALSACPVAIPLDCLPCTEDQDCAAAGLFCLEGRCAGERVVCPPASAEPAVEPVVLAQDDFESGTVLTSSTPPGKADRIELKEQPSTTASATAAAALGGRFGLEVVDTDGSGSGYGSSTFAVYEVDPLATTDAGRDFAEFDLRVHLRLSSTTTTPGIIPLQLHGNIPEATVAQFVIGGEPPTAFGSAKGMGAQVSCPSEVPFTLGQWHTLHYRLTGLGGQGNASFFLDGVKTCSLPMDFAGVQVERLLVGTPAVVLPWRGTVHVDDLALTAHAPPPGALRLLGPAAPTAGACVPLRLEAVDVLDAGLTRRPVVRTTPTALDAGVAAQIFPGRDCSGTPGAPVLDAGTSSVDFAVRLPTQGPVHLSAVDLTGDLDPAALEFQVGAPRSAQGCASTGLSAAALLAVLVARAPRRRRPPSR
ncbi:MAG: hypothetical protein K1X89_08360 [Myxococcaceae bacterium]|nr:hypothetical protein [Myxococcaceae bacterium]